MPIVIVAACGVMKKQETRRRKELRIKMTQVFNNELQSLSKEMRKTLLDDLVTAFENRLKVLQKRRMESEMQFLIANVQCYEVLQNT
jgi:hypothetical protein